MGARKTQYTARLGTDRRQRSNQNITTTKNFLIANDQLGRATFTYFTLLPLCWSLAFIVSAGAQIVCQVSYCIALWRSLASQLDATTVILRFAVIVGSSPPPPPHFITKLNRVRWRQQQQQWWWSCDKVQCLVCLLSFCCRRVGSRCLAYCSYLPACLPTLFIIIIMLGSSTKLYTGSLHTLLDN